MKFKNIILYAGFIIIFFISVRTVQGQNVSDITTLLSSDGQVYFGDGSNSIYVIDTPENVERIEEYLKIVDVQPRQVLIEARVAEVRLQGEHSLGINWSLFESKDGTKFGQMRIGGLTAESAIAQSIPFKPTHYKPGSTIATDQETPFTVTIFDDNINVVLNMLSNTFDTNILSAPRVTTVNNRPAEIQIVTELRFYEPQIDVGDGGTVSISFEEADDSPRDVGITLSVTPMISEDGKISMEIQSEVSEKTGEIELSASAGGVSVPFTIPIVDTRNTDTKVIIDDGNTLIIGGLIKDKVTKGVTKIPLMGDLPVLGRLFRSTLDTNDKTELLIFVSPTVITPQVTSEMANKESDKWYMQKKIDFLEDKLEKVTEMFKNRGRKRKKINMKDGRNSFEANIRMNEVSKALERFEGR